MITIGIDSQSSDRVAPVLAKVQETVPGADEAYVLKGALGVGLNFLLDPVYKITADDFAAPGGQDLTVDVEPIEGDEDRALILALAIEWPLGLTQPAALALVYSATLCTGLARLLGSKARITGPFSEVA